MPRSSSIAKVLCRTPTPGRQPTRIDAAIFAPIRRAILRAVPAREPGLGFADPADAMDELLPPADRARFGSLSWSVTTVKLELEVRGELRRLAGIKPQRLVRTVAAPR